jgi:hypothetical protein
VRRALLQGMGRPEAGPGFREVRFASAGTRDNTFRLRRAVLDPQRAALGQKVIASPLGGAEPDRQPLGRLHPEDLIPLRNRDPGLLAAGPKMRRRAQPGLCRPGCRPARGPPRLSVCRKPTTRIPGKPTGC